MATYYNENDKFAAAWLRQLIASGLLPKGDVDERSIVNVSGDDLRSYFQCHFFAGIGGWAYALALADWPEDREVWTGSCPCQPLSVAGQQRGHADERHLWPAFYRLIAERKPSVVFGEQVASKDGREWFAGVRADLEGAGYACGAAVMPACAVGAPHRRERLWWGAVADAGSERYESHSRGLGSRQGEESGDRHQSSEAAINCSAERVADAGCTERARSFYPESGEQQFSPCGEPPPRSGLERVADAELERSGRGRLHGGAGDCGAGAPTGPGQSLGGGESGLVADAACGRDVRPDESAGIFSGAIERGARRVADADGGEWLAGADGKARRVKPGVCLLANDVPNRVGKLRGLGNAIVPPLAAEFIRAFQDAHRSPRTGLEPSGGA